MKQNSQWLSHVRTRSNTALDTSMPSDAPARLLDRHRQIEAATTDVEFDVGLVGRHLPLDDVAWHLAVDPNDLVTGETPTTSAGGRSDDRGERRDDRTGSAGRRRCGVRTWDRAGYRRGG